MKLSRNVLVGSLATVGMVLGAVAPAVTAQAATTTGSVDKDTGTVTEIKDGSDIGKLNNDEGLLAIAYDGNANGATAESNASVTVVTGVLTLDYVPDFNFGTAASGGTVNLKDNTKDEATAVGQDGNEAGTLQVTEGRSTAPGFSLSASLGQFQDQDKNVVASGDDPFTLTLGAVDLFNGPDKLTNAAGKQLQTTAQTLKESSDGTDTGKVMSFAKGDDGYVGNAQYQATFKDPSSAQLHVSKNAKGTADKSAISYNAKVTWKLNADAAVVTP